MRLTFEECKELKDAGFPQMDGAHFIDETTVWDATAQSEFQTPNTPPRSEWAKLPTLSELIAACGAYVCLLQLPKEDGWIVWWSKEPFKKTLGLDSVEVFMEIAGTGFTPEQAVKNLWLTLHKNGIA